MARKVYRQMSLAERVFRHCDVMLKHASAKGLPVSAGILSDFAGIQSKTAPLESLKIRNSKFRSCQNFEFSIEDWNKLGQIQNELTRIVSPATPFTLLYVETDADKNWSGVQVFGSVPLVRRMMFMALMSLAILLSFAFIPNGNEIINTPLLGNKEYDLLFAVFFRLAAAGLGASFYALYKVKNYVGNYTFDPGYESTYWTEFVLGLMSGLIFSTLLDGQDLEALGSSGKMMSTIVVALIGGFASNVVYEFMNSMANALASVFKPDMKKVIAVEIDKAKASANTIIADKKQTLINHLTGLQSDIFTGKFSQDDISSRLNGLVKDLTTLEKTSTYTPSNNTTNTNTNTNSNENTSNPRVNIPKDIPSANDVNVRIDDIHPMSVSAIHEDDLNEATEEEYIDIFDTRA